MLYLEDGGSMLLLKSVTLYQSAQQNIAELNFHLAEFYGFIFRVFANSWHCPKDKSASLGPFSG